MTKVHPRNVVTPQKRSRSSTDVVTPSPNKRAKNETSMVLSVTENKAQPLPEDCLSHQAADPSDRWIQRMPERHRAFKCGFPGCGKVYTRLNSLKVHFFVHTGISNYKCPYEEKCGSNRYFRDRSDLNKHIRAKHTKERNYHCDFCKWRFARKDTLLIHMRRRHYDEWKRLTEIVSEQSL